jgi:hypothetical protein
MRSASVETIVCGRRARFAVGGGVGAALLHSRYQPLDRRIVHGLSAAAVRRERLCQEDRKRFGRRKQPLAVLGQELYHILQQLQASQQVEEAIGIRVIGLPKNAVSLPCGKTLSRIHGGRLLDGSVGFGTVTLPSAADFL